MLPVKLQPKLHIARISLDVCDFSELATELVNGIDLPIRSRRQAPVIIGEPRFWWFRALKTCHWISKYLLSEKCRSLVSAASIFQKPGARQWGQFVPSLPYCHQESRLL